MFVKAKKSLYCSVFFFSLFLLFGCQSLEQGKRNTASSVECEIGIIGGGPAGLYTAYRLAPKYKSQICLFEKENELGGRMRDEIGNLDSKKIWVGTGARRVNEVQKMVLNLGKELGVKFQTPEPRSQLILHKDHSGFSPDDFVGDYPGLIGPLDKDPKTTREDEIYELLLKERAKAKDYPELRSYIRAVAGEAALGFLRGASRFHADFDYEISTSNYLDYINEEYKTSSVNHYPVGGMSAFIRKMETAVTGKGVRIFKGEPLLEFESAQNRGYQLQTSKRTALVQHLIIAVPPVGFNYIKGSLAEEIRKKPEYQAIMPIRIVVINQWWDKEWWKNARDPKGKGNGAYTWRAWSTEQCVNHVEIPQEAYAKAGKVTRSVYTDDPECVKYWEKLYNEGQNAAVEREVVSGLSRLFNSPGTKPTIEVPKPLQTSMHLWPGGWYFVHAGAKVSNAEIAKWSIEPISGRKDLMLVGESYWLNRPGWSEGAYFSVHELLKARFAGVKF